MWMMLRLFTLNFLIKFFLIKFNVNLFLPFVNNLRYPPFILMGPGMRGFYYLGNETGKYVNA